MKILASLSGPNFSVIHRKMRPFIDQHFCHPIKEISLVPFFATQYFHVSFFISFFSSDETGVKKTLGKFNAHVTQTLESVLKNKPFF